MSKAFIMHMFTPNKNLSPFDVNMAVDAGWSTVVPYTHVEMDEVTALVQDAIFSRGPKGGRRTGVFLGGRTVEDALDMLELTRKAMVPPFELSAFADPSGAFTTAAGLVASVERKLMDVHDTNFEGQRVLIFGGTGPVGTAAAVLAARAGAKVGIVGHSGVERPRKAAEAWKARFDIDVEPVDGSDDDSKEEQLAEADVVFGTAKAGLQVVSAKNLRVAKKLKVAGDLNAVPPAGIEGIDPMDDGKPIGGLEKAVGVGALAVGNVKYQVQHALLREMLVAEDAQYFHFEHAFARAREHVGA